MSEKEKNSKLKAQNIPGQALLMVSLIQDYKLPSHQIEQAYFSNLFENASEAIAILNNKKVIIRTNQS